MSDILSFRGDAAIKATHVAQAEHHAAADMLVAGTYGDAGENQFLGCSVGCFAHDIDPTTDTNWHETVANARGLPEWLVRLQDSMFEGLPSDERATFHVELAKRIPVGVDLDPVQHWIAVARIDRMTDSLTAALEAKHGHGVHEAIEQTIAALVIGKRAHEAAAGGNVCDLSAARSARSAESAAESAAWSARSAAWSAAESAAWSARSAAESAAESAESAWSARSARSAESAAESAAWSARSAAESAAESAAWSAWSAWSARSAESAWKSERDALFLALDRAGQATN